MKRELAIAAGVLVPFALLVAAGFYFSAPAPKVLPVPVAPVVVPAPVAPSLPPVVAQPVVDAGVAVVVAPKYPPELAAPLEAVEAEVHQCFADQRVQRAHDVRVRFTPTRDGGYVGVEVDEQDPFLAACIEDVFAELHFEPRGAETYQPAEHTFSLAPAK